MAGSRDQLENEAAAAGLGEGDGGKAPQIFLGPDINNVARLLGEVCSGLPIFELNGELIYFDHNRESQVMTNHVFRSWINDFVTLCIKFNKESGDPIKTSIGIHDAKTVLDSLAFKRRIRSIKGVNQVRLPVLRRAGEDGERKIELLDWGYDDETGIFTVPGGLEYDEDWEAETGDLFLRKKFGGFPFSDPHQWAVHVGACLSLYIKHLLPEWSLRPGFCWMANKQGSGKSVLAKAALYPVLGTAAAAKLKKGEELDKELEAFILAARPYIFLDNVYGTLKSASLDALITSEESTGRSMGGHEVFTARNTAQLMVTGNNLELNEDALRRFLVIDLFEVGEPQDRKVDEPLNGSVMKSDEFRKSMLATMWAFVRLWDEGGREKGKLKLNSFEEYSEVLGGIVVSAGYVDPFTPNEAAANVSPEKVELKELMAGVLREMEGEQEKSFTLEDLAAIARALDLFSDKVGTEEDGKSAVIRKDGVTGDERKYVVDRGLLDPKQRTSWSRFLKPKVGGEFVIGETKLRLGERSMKRKVAYTISVIS